MTNKLEEAFNLYLKELYEAVSDEQAELKDYFKQLNSAEQVVRSAYTSRPDYKPKKLADMDYAEDCYKEVLEGDDHYREILQNNAVARGKNEEWLVEVRENKFYKGKELIDGFKEHPVQEAMTASKHFIPSHAKSKESLGGVLKYTQESVNKQRQFEELVRNTEVVQELQCKLDSQSYDIEEIQNHLSMMPSDKACKANYLKEKGYKLQQIADILSVSYSTVQRLLKGFK